MKLHNNFLGITESDTVLDFLPADTEERFEEGKKTIGPSWYYFNTPITYKINCNGHRSKNINEIDLENYILYTGCSHTFGIGLELEKTYGFALAKELNCDYYNLAMPGTGIDVLEYNLLMWFAKVKKPPKLAIIQMPDHSRYCNFNPYIHTDFFVESGTWAVDPEEQKMVVNCDSVGFFSARKLLTYKNIENIVSCPIVYVNAYGQANDAGAGLKLRNADLARDLAHYGLLSNQRLAQDLKNYIKQEFPDIFAGR